MCSLLNQPASNMIHKSEWCWDTAEEGQSLRGEAWSGRVWALKGRTLYGESIGEQEFDAMMP